MKKLITAVAVLIVGIVVLHENIQGCAFNIKETSMVHNFDQQRAETFAVWSKLDDTHQMPDRITLDLQFVPIDASSDWMNFEKELTELGYTTHQYDDGSTLEASIGPIRNDPNEIWNREFAATKVAIGFRFRPDGWGFLLDRSSNDINERLE